MIRPLFVRIVGALLLLAMLGGCAGHRAFRAGEELAQAGDYDAAVTKYARAVAAHPEKKEYRMRLHQARALASLRYLNQGRRLAEEGDIQGAAYNFGQAAALDPSNEAARQEGQYMQRRLQAVSLLGEAESSLAAGNYPQAKRLLDQVLQLDPGNRQAQDLQRQVDFGHRRPAIDGQEIALTSEKPVTLKFRDTDIREVFRILTKLSGINFVFDEDIRSQRITIFLEDASFPQALEFLLRMNNLGKKVLNSKTIIIYPRTKEKDKKYEDQVVRTFFLANINGKNAVNLLRTMLQLRKIYVHEELNALIIRDTPEVVNLVQQILDVADRADAEVLFDLELIELSHADDINLGPKLSNYSVSLGVGKGPDAANIVSSTLAPGGSTANLLRNFKGLETFYTLPTATFDFLKTMSNAEILAHPSIRVKNREKAKVHIGTREPVVTVTFTGIGDGTRTDSVQYVDVGVKLDIEPTIQLDDSVVTKLSLEVSSVSGRQTTQSGTQVLTITTTNAQSVLSLKNGERTIIGGLIRDDYSKGRNTIAGLGSIPLLGELFTSYTRRKAKREILLSITPHIIKKLELPIPEAASIWSGTEEDLKAGPAFGAFSFAGKAWTPETPPPAPQDKPAELIPPEPQTPAPEDQPMLPISLEKRTSAPARGKSVSVEAAVPETGETTPRVSIAGASQVSVGEEFTLTIMAAEFKNLYSAPLVVTYDPERLDFLQVFEGSFLGSAEAATIFTSNVDQTGGRVLIGHRQSPGGAGVSGGGDLVRLVFRAKSTGTAKVGLSGFNFLDKEGAKLGIDTAGLTLMVR
jgi:general secretion pathway protein D